MLKLYYAPRTRANRVRWALEELGVPYELVRLDMAKGQHKEPAYLAVHPLGQLPALEHDGQIVIESVAICLYLADRFPDKGLAPPLERRAAYYQWCVYPIGSIEGPLVQYFLHTVRLPEEERSADVARTARQDTLRVLGPVETALTGKTFLVDERFSTADVLIGSLLNWCGMLGLLGELPACRAFVERMRERPAYQRANQD